MKLRAIGPLQASDWHAHTPSNLSDGDGFWEWWYFEIDFHLRGDNWKIITVLHFPHAVDPRRTLSFLKYKKVGDFTKYPLDPRKYPGITSYVVCDRRNEALLITRLKPGSGIKISKSGPVSVELNGAASFRRIAADTYRLEVAHDGLELDPLGAEKRKLRLELRAVFHQNTAGFRPKNALIVDGGAQKVHWACCMPNPVVDIEHVVVKESNTYHVKETDLLKIEPRGGYHDHQWGDQFMFRHIADWMWGRVEIPGSGPVEDKLLFFAGRNLGDYPGGKFQDPVLAFSPGNGGASVSLSPLAGVDPLRVSEHRRWATRPIASQGMKYYRRLRLAGALEGGRKLQYDIWHRARYNVDVWPFYLRFLPRCQGGDGDSPLAISEYARWARIKEDKVKWVLAKSDDLNVRETGAV